jgi:hypothetical protein
MFWRPRINTSDCGITDQMNQEKKHGPAKRYLRRTLLGALLLIVCLCLVPVYTQFYSPKQRLWRDLTAYKKSIDAGLPRPDLVPHLTSNSVPLLLEWIETKQIPPSWQQSLAARLRPFSPSLASKLSSLDLSSTMYDPPTLALLGFEFLGSQASAALPALRKLGLRAETYDDAITAMIAIGPNAFPIAAEFAQRPEPRIRRTGAFLLGALRSDPAESSTILLKMISDPDDGVRMEAYQALAEFPSANTESVLIRKLVNADQADFFNIAYALHSGSTNALLHLLSIVRDSTERPRRIAALGALAFRDTVAQINSSNEPRNLLYGKKRPVFNLKALNFGMVLHTNPPDHLALDRVRSNILSTGLPRIEETFKAVRPAVILPSDLMKSDRDGH